MPIRRRPSFLGFLRLHRTTEHYTAGQYGSLATCVRCNVGFRGIHEDTGLSGLVTASEFRAGDR